MIDESNVKTDSCKAWLLAIRPKTLTGSAVPVIIGGALALSASGVSFQWIPWLLCLCFAMMMQIDSNLVNDYFDFRKGNDDDTRLGPKRATSQGWITPKMMTRGIAVVTLLACIIGLPLIIYGGLVMMLVGILCVIFCFLYTTTLSYKGYGDLLVVVFFGVVPVMLTYYLSMATGVTPSYFEAFVASLACGFVIDTLLWVNNFRDIDNDRRAGKITLAVKYGAGVSPKIYLGVGVFACLLGLSYLFSGHAWAFFFPLCYLAMHIKAYKKIERIKQGKELNRMIGETARNMLIYGLLVSVGILIS